MKRPLEVKATPDGELAFFRRLTDASKWAQKKRAEGTVTPPSWSRTAHLWAVAVRS